MVDPTHARPSGTGPGFINGWPRLPDGPGCPWAENAFGPQTPLQDMAWVDV
jgi:hypothetical protein